MATREELHQFSVAASVLPHVGAMLCAQRGPYAEHHQAGHQQEGQYPGAGRVIGISEVDAANANGNTDDDKAESHDELRDRGLHSSILKKFAT